MFISKTLAQNGEEYSLTLAKDGREGLEMAGKAAPDLILLDYILPDMTGADVCAGLLGQAHTSEIPVVLMSSNAHDIKKAESQYKNIVKSIAKPFTPDLLTATIRHVIRSLADQRGGAITGPSTVVSAPQTVAQTAVPPPAATEAQSTGAAPASRNVLFAGRSDFFPLYRAFISAQQAELTGVLRLDMQERAILCHIQNGRPVLITTHDAEAYFATPFPFTPKQAAALEAAMKRQHEDAAPVFLTLAAQGLLDAEPSAKLCRDYGARLLSKAWAGGRFTFEFEALDRLPAMTAPLKPSPDGMDQWMIESLRHVGDEALTAIAWGDLGGVPIYTRHGYERIQHVALTREEANFLGQIGSATLAEMATVLKIAPERAQQILFRFPSLEIFEYWPAAVLRGEV